MTKDKMSPNRFLLFSFPSKILHQTFPSKNITKLSHQKCLFLVTLIIGVIPVLLGHLHPGRSDYQNVKGVFFTAKMGAKKNVLMKSMIFVFLNMCEKHHLIGENCIQSLKNVDFAHFHSFYKGSLRQKSLK